MPEEFLVGLAGVLEGSIVEITRPELAKIEPYFSTREFGLLEKAVLLPFVFDGQIIALLLVGSSRLFERGDEELLRSLEESAALAAPIIREARATVRDSGLSESGSRSTERLRRLLREADAERRFVVIVRLDLDEIIPFLLANGQDIYRLRRDILSVLDSMVAESGELIQLRHDVLLLALASRKQHDERLIVHQIGSGLERLFGRPLGMTKLEPRVWTFPRTTSSIDELISEIVR